LQALVDNFDGDLPDYLPILGYDLLSHGPDRERRRLAGAGFAPSSECTLPILLSKVLLAFAIEFERDSGVSLAMSSNTLRLIGQEGARVRDLPRLSGVSKEAIAMSLGRLEERGLAFVQPESAGSRVKILRLTPKGRIAQDAYHRLILDVEQRSQARFGKDVVRNLRESLERLDGDAHRAPLTFVSWARTLPQRMAGGGPQAPRDSRTIQWFCTGAASQTAVEQNALRESQTG
jgi:DNA-binding MarR family transcriptional regulator